MSNARSELLLYLGVAFATTIGLFVLQRLYGTYIDRQYHAQLAERGPQESVLAAREEEQKLFGQGKMPLDQAMERLAQRGRSGFGTIAPAPSQDLSPLAGWIHQPGFKPVAAHTVRTPRAPEPAAPPPEAAIPPPEAAIPPEAAKPQTAEPAGTARPAPTATQPKLRQAR